MTNKDIRALEPKIVWNHFCDLNAVPRASKKEERVIQFMADFGEKLGLETLVDQVGNVIIKKPATKGFEGKTTIVLQSHLDMVHQKNNEVTFDFDTQGIEMYIEEGWVKAKGTTLGADNGMGVAAMMAVLSSDDVNHGPIECLFTIDEETGMTGAKGLQGGILEGKYLINLDSEEEGEIYIGCAGGVDTSVDWEYEEKEFNADFEVFKIVVGGLKGGHSGGDIHLQLGNANILLNRILWQLSQELPYDLVSFDGGGLRNAIPREANAVVGMDMSNVQSFQETLERIAFSLKQEYQLSDNGLFIETKKIDEKPKNCVSDLAKNAMIRAIYACPNGVHKMSENMDGLVETSSNLARILITEGTMTILTLQRSSVESLKWDIAWKVSACFENIGAKVKHSGEYPGWEPKPTSEIKKLMEKMHIEVFGKEAEIMAIHAGLECGILGQNYPEMEMISVGPTIRGAHSPDERCKIDTVENFWTFLTKSLASI
ncbi:MAG: aminoacyl-histidine dipeptidase [Flavobacteriales bacterium]|jgi:dipeptidase D|nr:aminoacyl-histidine dipeptidase [Flavobacteriales bacterium]